VLTDKPDCALYCILEKTNPNVSNTAGGKGTPVFGFKTDMPVASRIQTGTFGKWRGIPNGS
jgi:hypothetical protein